MNNSYRFAGWVALALSLPIAIFATEPIIPPTILSISPAGMQRGTTTTFAVEGRNLAGATEVIFDSPGITGKMTEIADVPEKITGPKAGEDLGAQVPLGKKQSAKLEITIAKDAEPGIHRFRVKTPLGTSNTQTLAVGILPEMKKRDKTGMDAGGPAQSVDLPATLIGSIDGPGEKDQYQFEGKAGEDLVFRTQASELGSRLESALVLSDADGHVLASAGQDANRRDAVLLYHLTQAGRFSISISDRDNGGGKGYFYRLDAGALPYVKTVFPLGLRAGQPTQISVSGANLGGINTITVRPPSGADSGKTMRLEGIDGRRPFDEVRLAVGDVPEILEREPNDSIAQAQDISLPITINGHIAGGMDRAKTPDEDFFRFTAKKGQKLSIEVTASRLAL